MCRVVPNKTFGAFRGRVLKKGEVLERMAGEEVREGSDLCSPRGHGSSSLFIHFIAISWQYFCRRNKLQDLIMLKWSPSSLRHYWGTVTHGPSQQVGVPFDTNNRFLQRPSQVLILELTDSFLPFRHKIRDDSSGSQKLPKLLSFELWEDNLF